jgi:hypothetical protein
MTKVQPKFTTEEINARLECLKIASKHTKHDSEICFLARNLYYWLTSDNDPECFYEGVELPDGTVISSPNGSK